VTEQDRQLVELITRQVMELLRQRGVGGDSAAGSAASPAPPHGSPVAIHPPIGTCTGDYSKFPELRGRTQRSPAQAASPLPAGGEPPEDYAAGSRVAGELASVRVTLPSRTEPPEDFAATGDGAGQPVPLTGIITAKQLQEAVDIAGRQPVWLAPDARLTPLANDLARQLKDRIRRGAPAAATGSAGAAAGTPAMWLWWIEGGCPAVRQAVSAFAGTLRPLASGAHASALSNVVRELARQLKSKQIAGAVLFVPNAARAVCLANRCASIRAVVATCGEAVEQGIADLGANVLIVEYPHHGSRAMTVMLSRFMQQPPSVPAAVERDLADLHRCG
jgi:hypothetical protein